MMEPEMDALSKGSNPMSANDVTDFPLPDSPTIPTISLGCIVNEQSLTNCCISVLTLKGYGEVLYFEHVKYAIFLLFLIGVHYVNVIGFEQPK